MPIQNRESLVYLTHDEWKRLLGVIDKLHRRNRHWRYVRDRAIFVTAYTYALRASEVGLLRVADIDLNRERIFIRRLKGSISGEWPLLPDVTRVLKRWLREREALGWGQRSALFLSQQGLPISRTMLHVLMRKYGKLAKLPPHKRHFHVLKHTRVMHLLEQTHDIVGTQHWVGHKNITNTMHYVHLVGFHREEFARQLT